MREHDVRECRALGKEPKDALRLSIRASIEAFTALGEDGKPIALLGVGTTNLMSGKGEPWLLGSDELFRYGYHMVELGPQMIGAWLGVFHSLENIVSVENTRAIRLLKLWGATVEGEVTTHRGLEFIPFRFERAVIQDPTDAT